MRCLFPALCYEREPFGIGYLTELIVSYRLWRLNPLSDGFPHELARDSREFLLLKSSINRDLRGYPNRLHVGEPDRNRGRAERFYFLSHRYHMFKVRDVRIYRELFRSRIARKGRLL